MAEILVFRAQPRSGRRTGPHGADGAEILFFTGVRYMRMEDADTTETTTRKTPRRNGKQAAPRRSPRKRA
ncbi:MAG TPA: hypothetical protein PKA55_17195 [Rhodoblastus sp.]|nr:hypothetical protein [Rhodoblastus sp.]